MKKKTLMLMTDISGYTRFLTTVGHEEGLRRAQEMLQIIIRSNRLGLKLCEVEGDAVFFYVMGRFPSTRSLLAQVRRTYQAFARYLSSHGLSEQLGIKFFIHAGECEEMRIGGRIKLFGTEVIRIHRLLKTISNKPDYLLVTHQAQDVLQFNLQGMREESAEFPHLGCVQYTVFDGAYILEADAGRSRFEHTLHLVADAIDYGISVISEQYRQYASLLYPLQGVI